MIGVGVVGYGYAGRSFHTYLVPLAAGLELRAIVARDPDRRQKAEEERGVKTYATLDALLTDEAIQLVVLATPHDTHADLAIQAMNRGRHVVTDKVMCMNAREADAMIEAAERNRVTLSVFHNRRWDWDYLTLRDVLHKELIGAPYLFEASVLRNRSPRGWRGSKEHGGGILYDWGAHLLDQALQLVPECVRGVECAIQHRSWGGEIGSYGRLLLKFDSGVLYQIEVGNLCTAPKPRWYVLGDTGAFIREQLDPQERPMVAGNIEATDEPPGARAVLVTEREGQSVRVPYDTVRGSWKGYYQNIADHLNRGTALAVTPAQVRRQMAVFDAAMESACTGKTVRPDGER